MNKRDLWLYSAIFVGLMVIAALLGVSFSYINHRNFENVNVNATVDSTDEYVLRITPVTSDLTFDVGALEYADRGNDFVEYRVNKTVKLTSTSKTPANFSCNYQLIYKSTSNYYNYYRYDDTKEFTIEAMADSTKKIVEMQMPNVNKDSKVVLGSYSIAAGTTDNWTITFRFYNLSSPQLSSVGVEPPAGELIIKEAGCGVS